MHIAADGGHLNAVKLLIKEFPDWINSKSLEGETPLSIAIRAKRAKVVRTLISFLDKSQINEKICDLFSPFFIAVECDSLAVVRVLVINAYQDSPDQLKSLLRETNLLGETVLHIAVRENHIEMVRFLVDLLKRMDYH